jgi:hypothetical protein
MKKHLGYFLFFLLFIGGSILAQDTGEIVTDTTGSYLQYNNTFDPAILNDFLGGTFWDANGNNIYNTNPGNVAIGSTTLTPNSRLTVFGSGWNGGLEINNTGGQYSRITSANDGLLFRNFSSTGIGFSFRNSTDAKLLAILQNGNIGIGTSTPSEKLVVNGRVAVGTTSSPYAGLTVQAPTVPNTTIEAIIGICTNGTAILAEGVTGYVAYKLHSNLGGANSFGTLGLASGEGNYADFATAKDVILRADNEDLILTASSNIRFGTNPPGSNIEVMTILNNGSVGIGTTNPGTNKLAVNGTIKATEILVSTQGWSDFVFDDNYKLLSLTEVETFIKNNRHLPDIPNAAEVEKDGIQLGEMQTKLLQKIEELTLYMIELNKENQELRTEIDTIKGLAIKEETIN